MPLDVSAPLFVLAVVVLAGVLNGVAGFGFALGLVAIAFVAGAQDVVGVRLVLGGL